MTRKASKPKKAPKKAKAPKAARKKPKKKAVSAKRPTPRRGRPKKARVSGKAYAKATAKPRAVAKERIGKEKAPAPAWPPPTERRVRVDTLDLVRKVLTSSDMLFLSRQVAYHMSTSGDLPKAWADPERMRYILSRLLEHIVKRAPRRSSVMMELDTHSLRSGPGVELRMMSTDHHLEDVETSAFMARLYSAEPDGVSGISLAELREMILKSHGRMWVDLPKPTSPVYHVVIPTNDKAADVPRAEHQTFKYDIQITNYSSVRKRFGIRKSLSIVDQVERFVRSLVRYPMDMVMSAGEKGIVTTIYETQMGGAESISGRISQRLGREAFHIGRRPVELNFRYKLSALTVTPAGSKRTAKKTKRRR
jgi:hypothetical protein